MLSKYLPFASANHHAFHRSFAQTAYRLASAMADDNKKPLYHTRIESGIWSEQVYSFFCTPQEPFPPLSTKQTTLAPSFSHRQSLKFPPPNSLLPRRSCLCFNNKKPPALSCRRFSKKNYFFSTISFVSLAIVISSSVGMTQTSVLPLEIR